MSGSICLFVQHIRICAFSVLSSLNWWGAGKGLGAAAQEAPVCRSSALAQWARAEPRAVNVQHECVRAVMMKSKGHLGPGVRKKGVAGEDYKVSESF